MGLYLVTSDANGCSEVIAEGAGIVVKAPGDAHAVADAMRSALERHLTKQAIRETVRYLDFELQIQKIVDICIEDMKNP
jgi:glycosyltransferase involved in cell wall biosynthesis